MIDNLTDKLAPIEPTTREELRKQLKSIPFVCLFAGTVVMDVPFGAGRYDRRLCSGCDGYAYTASCPSASAHFHAYA